MRLMRDRFGVLFGLATSVFLSLFAQAHEGFEEVSIVPAADTSLFEAEPNNNLGSTDNMIIGGTAEGTRNRGLLRFDLRDKAPANAAIREVTLTLTVVNKNGSGAPTTLSLHRLLQPWNEGTKSGNRGQPATAGEATWNSRALCSAAWSQPGATAPVDFVAEPSAQVGMDGPGDVIIGGSTNLTSDIQYWVEHPDQNFGWIIICVDENTAFSARRIASRENSNSPPTLQFEYKIAGEELRINEFGLVDKYFLLHLDLEAEKTYVVQFKTSLSQTNWMDLTNFPAETVFRHFVLADPLVTNQHRIYRLMIPAP